MRAKVDEMDMKSESNATQIADIVKYQANSNKDYEGVEHENLNARLIADYIMMMDRFNKARLLPYESEFISASNSYEGKTRDNVIKGRTLQNISGKINIQATGGKIENGKIIIDTTSNSVDGGILFEGAKLIKPSSTYSLIYNVLANENYTGRLEIDGAPSYCFNAKTMNNSVGTHCIVLTSKATWEILNLYKINTNTLQGKGKLVLSDKFLLLEGDYTSKPIPSYFEGIKSVNEDGENLEEVSCGKNILNWKKEEFETIGPVGKIEKDELGITFDCLGSTTGGYGIKTIKIFHLKPNTQYTFSADWDILRGNPRYSKPYVRVNSITTNTFEGSRDGLFTFTTDNVGMYKLYLYVDNPSPEDVKVRFKDMFFSEGVEKANEPYIEHRLPIKMKNLRSLPNGICDTSDGVRRIGEIILNGSESWGNADVSSSKTIRITLSKFLECVMGSNNENIINNKLPSKYIYSSDEEGIFITRAIGNKGNIYIRVLKNKLASQDIAGFKAWLQANPITIYYELATPTKEDGNTEELRTYDGQTNIFTEGSLIEPTISCKVPSNVQAVVMNLRSENEALNNDVNTLQATTEENNLMNIETNVNQEARLTMLELGVI